ncbi:MAG TPA: hypothetical protein VF444_22110, partial [Pseudonocardiaceae bacterium]
MQADRVGNVTFNQMLNSMLPEPRVPCLLPRAHRGFLNRRLELERLDRWVLADRKVDEPTRVVIYGPRGVGTSALLARYVRANEHRFPGGVLTADLGGSWKEKQSSVSDVLEGFLVATGLPAGMIPQGQAARFSLYQQRTDNGQPILVALDNAADARQVLDLLPTSNRAVVLVASSQPLDRLITEADFRPLRVSPLRREIAIDLVCARLEQVDKPIDRGSAGVLVDACGGLPQILAVASTQLALRYEGRVDSYLMRLTSRYQFRDRPAMAGGPEGPEHLGEIAVLDTAYHELDAAQALAYRLLSRLPASLGVGTAAALLGLSEPAARMRLDGLVTAGLLENEDDRYLFHDLQRDHALRQPIDGDQPEAAFRRLALWTRDWVAARDLLLSDRVRDWPWAASLRPAYSGSDARARAVADLEQERLNLLAIVRLAEERKIDEPCCQLCDALWTFYFQHDHYEDSIIAYQIGVRAADRTAGSAAVRMHAQLGVAYYTVGNNEVALEHLRHSLTLARQAHLPAEVQNAFVWIGLAHEQAGRFDAARTAFAQARELTLAVSDESTRKRMLAMLDMHDGRVLVAQGQAAAARERLLDAEHFFAGVPTERTNRARVLLVL